MKGVTIKDVLETIHKQFKKKADDELGEKPYLAGFEWDREEVRSAFIVSRETAILTETIVLHQVHRAPEGSGSTNGQWKEEQEGEEA
jgi:hypothetical protein